MSMFCLSSPQLTPVDISCVMQNPGVQGIGVIVLPRYSDPQLLAKRFTGNYSTSSSSDNKPNDGYTVLLYSL
jgi:hypothetical protein